MFTMNSLQASWIQYLQGQGLFNLFSKKSLVMTSTGQAPILSQSQVEEIVHDQIEPQPSWFHRWFPYLKWSPTSPEDLAKAEEELLSYVKTKSQGQYVEVEMDDKGQKCRIWTRIFKNEEAEDKVPLVMVHGMGSGLALFAMNYDQLAKSRTIYAIGNVQLLIFNLYARWRFKIVSFNFPQTLLASLAKF